MTDKLEQIRERYVSRSQVRRLTAGDARIIHDDIACLLAALDTLQRELDALRTKGQP